MRYFFLRLLQLFCLFILTLGIFIGLFPRLMSTDWGRQQFVKGVNHFIPGKIEIQSLQLQWTKSQIIRGFTLKDPKGEVILKIERLSIDAPFWKILTQRIHGSFIQIKALSAMLAIDEKGQNNFEYALGLMPTQGKESVSRLVLMDVNAHLHLFAHYHHFVLWAQGRTRQLDLEGLFEIDFVLNGLRLSNWKNVMSDIQRYFHDEGSRRAAIQLKVTNFPTDVIDHLFSFKFFHSKPFFRPLMGNHVNIVLCKEPNAEGCLDLKIQSPFVEGEISGRLAKGAFTLQEPAHFHVDVNTELLQAFTHPHTQLYQLAAIDITSHYLYIPLALFDSQAMPDFCQCGFKIDVAIGKTEMNFHPLGLLSIHRLVAQLNSKSRDSHLYFQTTGFINYNEEPTHINFERWFKKPSNFSAFLNDLLTAKSDSNPL